MCVQVLTPSCVDGAWSLFLKGWSDVTSFCVCSKNKHPQFAGFLTAHEKYRLARRVMHVVVAWNEFWLGLDSPALAPVSAQKQTHCWNERALTICIYRPTNRQRS
jgi:hypothetical protein